MLINVLDARDPMGTRCRAVEQYLKKEAPHKHLVFVLNKCDLVPTWVAVSPLSSPFRTPFSGSQMFSQGLFVFLSKRSCYDFGKSTLYRLWTTRSELGPPDTWVFLQSRGVIPSLSQVSFHVMPLSIERYTSSHGLLCTHANSGYRRDG